MLNTCLCVGAFYVHHECTNDTQKKSTPTRCVMKLYQSIQNTSDTASSKTQHCTVSLTKVVFIAGVFELIALYCQVFLSLCPPLVKAMKRNDIK